MQNFGFKPGLKYGFYSSLGRLKYRKVESMRKYVKYCELTVLTLGPMMVLECGSLIADQMCGD